MGVSRTISRRTISIRAATNLCQGRRLYIRPQTSVSRRTDVQREQRRQISVEEDICTFNAAVRALVRCVIGMSFTTAAILREHTEVRPRLRINGSVIFSDGQAMRSSNSKPISIGVVDYAGCGTCCDGSCSCGYVDY